MDALHQDDAGGRRARPDLPHLSDLHLLDSLWGIGFVLMMMNLPILIWMLYTYFKEIPVDILEAARMDGASLLNEIVYVLTPMAVPGIASTHAACCHPFVERGLLDAESHDLERGAAHRLHRVLLGAEGFFWAKLSAASTLAIAPILVLGWFSQKQLVRGLTFGAVK